MSFRSKIFVALVLLGTTAFYGCSSDGETNGSEHDERRETARGEHDRDNGEHGREHGRAGSGEHGEETGTELTLTDRYDEVRNGARLILAYDRDTNSFVGTVENTTENTLEQVRVEVHLSNGKELGPTAPDDLGPGERNEVKLTATSRDFDKWTAHPEVGSSEHGHREERGEHD